MRLRREVYGLGKEDEYTAPVAPASRRHGLAKASSPFSTTLLGALKLL